MAVAYLAAANAFLILIVLVLSIVYADSRRVKQKTAAETGSIGRAFALP